MPKILASMLFLGMLMWARCNPPSHTQVSTATPGAPATARADKSTVVQVTFDGLMTFEKLPDGHYEVGVLPRAASQDHYFQIVIDGKAITLPKQTTATPIWTLDVVTPSGIKPQDIYPRSHKPCNRLQDTTAFEDLDHAYDFCWIMDLENDFGSPRTLKLKSDALIPIISLRNGELYTLSKYDEQERQDSRKNYVEYGFVAETIALQIKLAEGEKVRLRVPGRADPLFTLDENT